MFWDSDSKAAEEKAKREAEERRKKEERERKIKQDARDQARAKQKKIEEKKRLAKKKAEDLQLRALIEEETDNLGGSEDDEKSESPVQQKNYGLSSVAIFGSAAPSYNPNGFGGSGASSFQPMNNLHGNPTKPAPGNRQQNDKKEQDSFSSGASSKFPKLNRPF